jgi:hypothetical protein
MPAHRKREQWQSPSHYHLRGQTIFASAHKKLRLGSRVQMKILLAARKIPDANIEVRAKADNRID